MLDQDSFIYSDIKGDLYFSNLVRKPILDVVIYPYSTLFVRACLAQLLDLYFIEGFQDYNSYNYLIGYIRGYTRIDLIKSFNIPRYSIGLSNPSLNMLLEREVLIKLYAQLSYSFIRYYIIGPIGNQQRGICQVSMALAKIYYLYHIQVKGDLILISLLYYLIKYLLCLAGKVLEYLSSYKYSIIVYIAKTLLFLTNIVYQFSIQQEQNQGYQGSLQEAIVQVFYIYNIAIIIYLSLLSIYKG